MIAAAVVSPMPGMETRISKRRARQGSPFDLEFDLDVQIGDRSVERPQLAIELADQAFAFAGAQPIEERGAVVARRLAAAHEPLQALEEFAWRLADRGIEAFAEDGQYAGVDEVGLGERPDRLGEEPRAQGIDDGDPKAAGAQGTMGKPMELACGLHDNESDVMVLQQALEPPDSVCVVVYGQLLADRVEVHVEFLFTDVDSDIDSRCVWIGRNLALHAGLAPHHLSRPSAKDGRIQLTRGSKPRAHDSARPTARGWPPPGGHPEGLS